MALSSFVRYTVKRISCLHEDDLTANGQSSRSILLDCLEDPDPVDFQLV